VSKGGRGKKGAKQNGKMDDGLGWGRAPRERGLERGRSLQRVWREKKDPD